MENGNYALRSASRQNDHVHYHAVQEEETSQSQQDIPRFEVNRCCKLNGGDSCQVFSLFVYESILFVLVIVYNAKEHLFSKQENMVSLLFDFLTLLFFLSEILYVFVHVMQLIQAVFVNCLSDQTRNFFLPIRNILFLVRKWWYVVGVYFLLVVFIALTIDGILYTNYYEKLIPQTRCFVFLEGWLILFWGDVSLIFRPFQICCCKSSSNLPYTWSYMHNLSDNVICAICLDTMDQNFVRFVVATSPLGIMLLIQPLLLQIIG